MMFPTPECRGEPSFVNTTPIQAAIRYGLLPAWQLYENPVYELLKNHCGLKRLYILSAGWGLITAGFLTPCYDITFTATRPQVQVQTQTQGRPIRRLLYAANRNHGAHRVLWRQGLRKSVLCADCGRQRLPASLVQFKKRARYAGLCAPPIQDDDQNQLAL